MVGVMVRVRVKVRGRVRVRVRVGVRVKVRVRYVGNCSKEDGPRVGAELDTQATLTIGRGGQGYDRGRARHSGRLCITITPTA